MSFGRRSGRQHGVRSSFTVRPSVDCCFLGASMQRISRSSMSCGEPSRPASFASVCRRASSQESVMKIPPPSQIMTAFSNHDPASDYWPFPNSDQLDFLPEDVIGLGEVTDTGKGIGWICHSPKKQRLWDACAVTATTLSETMYSWQQRQTIKWAVEVPA